MKRSLVRPLVPVVLAAALLGGCSSGGGDGDSGATTTDLSARAERPAQRSAADSYALSEHPNGAAEPQALIKKGTVVLRADDVGSAQAQVQQVADRYAGQVTSEETESDDDGRPTHTRMVLRIPSADFSKAVAALKEAGELESASTNEDDVTDEVIDTSTRLRVQQRSIDRITVLFDRAQSIRDIMAIEGQLSRRQADLESLQRRADLLANQTSLATIVVSIDRAPEAKPEQEDDTGFLAGLAAGWDALTGFGVGLATAAGAALPWLVVALVLGVPVLLLVRTLRRRTPAPPAPADGQPSE